MTTTRNPDLDRLIVGQSLFVIDKEPEKTKLRSSRNKMSFELGGRLGGGDLERAAIRLEGKIEMLRKGRKYI
jgi:hypothetical protein